MQPDFPKTAKALIEGLSRQVDKLFAPYETRFSEFEKRMQALEDRQPEPGPPGEKGERGEPGRDGVGMAGALVDRNGVLVVTLSDGTAKDLGPCIGKDGRDGVDGKDGQDGTHGIDGKDGAPGRGIVKAEVSDGGLLILTYSDGDVEETGVVVGPQGEKGEPGRDGTDGVDGKDGANGKDGLAAPIIENITVDDAGDLIVKYGRFETNEFRDFNAGRVRGLDGKDGEPGERGDQGERGEPGENGIDGKDGIGIDEVNINDDGELVLRFTGDKEQIVGMVRGSDGKDGAPGRDGRDGQNGIGICKAEINEAGVLLLHTARAEGEVCTTLEAGAVRGKDGADGKSVTDVTVKRDGENVIFGFDLDGITYEYECEMPKGIVGPQGEPGKDGRGIEKVLIDDTGMLVFHMTDMELPFPVGVVKGAPGNDGTPGRDGKDGRDGVDGKDGKDGLSLKHFNVQHGEDGQTIVMSLEDETERQEYELRFPILTYEELWSEKRAKEVGYFPGNSVTWGGNIYTAVEKTDKKPDGPGSGWRLSVRRGRDGKDAR